VSSIEETSYTERQSNAECWCFKYGIVLTSGCISEHQSHNIQLSARNDWCIPLIFRRYAILGSSSITLTKLESQRVLDMVDPYRYEPNSKSVDAYHSSHSCSLGTGYTCQNTHHPMPDHPAPIINQLPNLI
jgi:hypothetical protein